MLDAAGDGLLALDEHGAIVEANAAAALLVGHARTRLRGKPLAALVPLEERRALRAALLRLAPGRPEELELHVGPASEPWRVTLALVPRATPRALTATFHREPGRLAPQPQGTSRRLRYFMLRFPYAVVALRADLHVLFANARARSLLGRDAVRTGAVFGEGTSPLLRALAARLVNVPVPLPPAVLELDERTLRVSGVPAAADEPAMLLLEDVTEQYRRNRVMHEFLRNAAHQLRTPIAGIMAAVEMLQAGAKETPADRDRFLGHIETHAVRLTRVAGGLLALARHQSGERMATDVVALEPLLRRVAAEIVPAEGVAVDVRCDPGTAVLAAPDLLHEALAALADNAAVHTREGSIALVAAGRAGRAEIAVADTGPGILPEFTDRVFEPFFRIGHDGNGHGLGLAIAARAVEAMGGGIGVDSVPGRGTTFTVTLRSASAAG